MILIHHYILQCKLDLLEKIGNFEYVSNLYEFSEGFPQKNHSNFSFYEERREKLLHIENISQ